MQRRCEVEHLVMLEWTTLLHTTIRPCLASGQFSNTSDLGNEFNGVPIRKLDHIQTTMQSNSWIVVIPQHQPKLKFVQRTTFPRQNHQIRQNNIWVMIQSLSEGDSGSFKQYATYLYACQKVQNVGHTDLITSFAKLVSYFHTYYQYHRGYNIKGGSQ